MAIDPNIALGVQTTQLNPLQTATQAAQLGYLLTNSNKLQQEVNANKAISAAYQQATDPNTGVVDNNKLSAIISQNPDAAYNLGTVQQGINTQKQQQVALQSSQLQQAQTAQTNLRQGLGGLITKPDLSPQDIQGFIQTQVQAGAITPQVAQAELQSMPTDPTQLRSWAVGHYESALSGENQLHALTPTYANINTGPSTIGVNTNPFSGGGVGKEGYIVQNGMSPEAASTPTQVNVNGQPQAITRQQFVDQANANGGVNTAPPQGSEALSAGAIGRYNTLQSAANAAKPLMQTYDLAAQAAQSTISGKGGSQALNVPSILNTFGIQVSADKVKNNQNLVAYLNSAADQAASALGLSGSDARIAAAKAGQPNTETMNIPALLDQIQHVKGLQQAVLDRANATNNFLARNGNNTSQLPQFENQWNQSFNPDVSYVRSLPTPALQQAAIQKIVQSGQGQQFMQSYQAMKNLGAF